MNASKETINYKLLVNIAITALLVYNLLFIYGRFQWFSPDIAQTVMDEIRNNKGFLTILEILGVASVFVDLVGRYEKIGESGVGKRRLRVVLIAFFFIMFFFKLFINYLDSAFA